MSNSNLNPQPSNFNPHPPTVSRKILLQVTGSIAAFKAAALTSKLVQAGYDLEVVLSEGAESFIGSASFEGLTRKPVHRGLYEPGKMMAHIDLERWADLILIYPATANTLATLATGRSDSLIGSIFLAHEFKKPYWIAPAMNQAMFKHPATQTHVQSLKNWGIHLVNPDAGALACGEIGPGRLVEPEVMAKHIQSYFESGKTASDASSADKKQIGKHANIRILVTSGGTSEPIDSVRSITNFSTGETGYTVAKALWHQGYDVTFVQARSSHFQVKHEPFLRSLNYDTTTEFTDTVKKELQSHEFHYVVHAAAVSDYRVESTVGKIQTNEPFSLKLIPSEKVLKSVRHWSKNPKMKVISFKLTAGNSDLKLESYDSDWIIHNELKNVKGEQHNGTLFIRSTDHYTPLAHFTTKTELAHLIIKLIEKDEL